VRTLTKKQRHVLALLQGSSTAMPKVTSTDLPLRTCRQLSEWVRIAQDPAHRRTWWVWLKENEMNHRNRVVTTMKDLSRKFPDALDKLPSPAEFRGYVGKGKKRKLLRQRKTWVGFGWTDEGNADGTEPLLVLDETTVNDPVWSRP